MVTSPSTSEAPAGRGDDALRDFWSVYDSHFEAVSGALRERIAADPELSAALRSREVVDSQAANGHSHELLRKALLDGEWGLFESSLREQGASYARAGLPLAVWARVTSMLRTALLHHLMSAFAADPRRLAAAIEAKGDFLDRVMVILSDEYLNTKEAVIRQQSEALQVLSTPVLRVRDRLLLMPIIGVIDTYRARQLTEALLQAIHSDRAKAVVIDITGVPAVDSRVAQHLIQAVTAARLMGTIAIVTGLSPDVAQSLVALGLDLAGLRTVGDLQGGLETAERLIADGAPATRSARG